MITNRIKTEIINKKDSYVGINCKRLGKYIL